MDGSGHFPVNLAPPESRILSLYTSIPTITLQNNHKIHILSTSPLTLHPSTVPSSATSLQLVLLLFLPDAISSGTEAVERPNNSRSEPPSYEGCRIGEFRRRLKIADIKGGPDEGLDPKLRCQGLRSDYSGAE